MLKGVVGRGGLGNAWHIVRLPHRNEDGPRGRLVSLCGHIWQVNQITLGGVTCLICIKRFTDDDHRAIVVGMNISATWSKRIA